MELIISPLAENFIRKNVRSLGLVLTVKDGYYSLTPYRDYSFFLGAHEEFERIHEGSFVVVAPYYLGYQHPAVRIGLFHNDSQLVVLGRHAHPTLVDRRWRSSSMAAVRYLPEESFQSALSTIS